MNIRDLDSKKIGTEVFGDLRNVVGLLEEKGEDKMVRESTLCTTYRREEDTSK